MALLCIAIAGCSSHRQSFPESPPDQVWVAMKSAASEPTYTDWIVLENAVVVEEEKRTIQIYRRLRRDQVSPGVAPRRENQEWKLTILMEQASPAAPVEAVFIAREPSAPMNAEREAERYFNDVRLLLGLDPLPHSAAQRWSSKPASAANPAMGGGSAARPALPASGASAADAPGSPSGPGSPGP
jgi:hypothetical protein